MANNQQLKDSIRAVIKQNGNEEITGNILQQALIAMIDALGMGYQFMGEAKPETNPAPTDARVMYIAIDSGTYSNFVTPPIELDGSKIAIFLYSSAWSAILLNVPNNQYIATELLKKVDKVAGKGLSTNDYTDADKLRVQNALLVSDIVDSLGDGTTKVISQAAMTEILLNYARIDGYYSSLIAGAAENLVGRGYVPALFTFRTTGGTADVGSGTAQIKKLYGNSIVWNQLVNALTDVQFSNEDYEEAAGIVTITPTGANSRTVIKNFGTNIIANRKYLAMVLVKCVTASKVQFINYFPGGTVAQTNGDVVSTTEYKWCYSFITASVIGSANLVQIYSNNQGTYQIVKDSARIIDLTLMFGQGKEPATVEEFEALYYLPYYAHNPGAIKNTTAIGIKTVGRNLFNPETGKAHLPGATGVADLTNGVNCYQIIGNYTSITDEDGNAITPNAGGFFAVSSKQDITVIGGDSETCICLTWSGYRNGEYEPYWERTINLPLTTMTGKLNGEGESVVIAPDGWMSAGDARFVGIVENGMLTKVEKRVAQVDLGTLIYSKQTVGTNDVFTAAISTKRLISGTGASNLICSQYAIANRGPYNAMVDKTIMEPSTTNPGNCISIRDSAYTDSDATAFKAAMDGVMLNYELATPEVYVLDEPINMNYSEDDFGTEERLPADTADNVSAPIFFDVQYPMNAVDILRRLGVNYIKKESMDHILQAFVNAGIIGSYSLTYNATNDDYDCVVTEPVQP